MCKDHNTYFSNPCIFATLDISNCKYFTQDNNLSKNFAKERSLKFSTNSFMEKIKTNCLFFSRYLKLGFNCSNYSGWTKVPFRVRETKHLGNILHIML